MYKGLITICLWMLCLNSIAQSKRIWGFVLDSITKTPIENASITNTNNKQTVVSNNMGRFNLEISKQQIISVASINHYFDTLLITDKIFKQDTFFIFLKPITRNLKDVTVTAIINRYVFDSIERRKSFLEGVGNYKISTISKSNSGAGIALNIDHFSAREKNKRRAYRLFEMLEKEQYINYRFNQYTVTKYSTLQGDDLTAFMQTYRPTYEWLRTHTSDEDMKYYINDCLKKYFKK